MKTPRGILSSALFIILLLSWRSWRIVLFYFYNDNDFFAGIRLDRCTTKSGPRRKASDAIDSPFDRDVTQTGESIQYWL